MGLHDAEGLSKEEHTGQLGELRRHLEWTNSRRNESIELQKKMIKKIKILKALYKMYRLKYKMIIQQ